MTNQTVTQILKNLKAVVFDIDGTIMDSVSRIVKCLQESCMAFGLPAPEKDACKNVIGLTLPEAIAALLPKLKAYLRRLRLMAIKLVLPPVNLAKVIIEL